ncbi:MAG: Holliday junction branch migration protein RuvA [Clostridia bacterium]|nr:Holliday junction branch migration protein RuvA [Clostridia bacterium]
MFYSVRGRLIFKGENFVVIECAGVGYRCYTSQNTINKIGNMNSEAFLYTQLVVREDAMELYGFYNTRELELFKLLCTVSGVGAKMAVSILSVLPEERFVLAVVTSDTASISQTQGVGRKKAERIVLELKDKINTFNDMLPSANADYQENSADTVLPKVSSGNISKAVEALGVLGYTQGEVMPILLTMDSTQAVEKLISGVLKEMGRR